jgi:methylenetetrahydrofolate dehydrogenase (NADP+)/methenyltetrahydrofolate cyclohydrolase
MKLLNGRELAGFIKERQAKQVRSLKQSKNIQPKLIIIKTKDEPVINTYVRLKQKYGADIGVEVEILDVPQSEVVSEINTLNHDDSVHGIIVQLPLEDPSKGDEVLNAVSLEKDVDGLASGSGFDPATPTAIMWLLAGYNIDLRGKKFAVIGKGPLVGAPLIRMLEASEHEVVSADRATEDISGLTQDADIIISATGRAGLLTNDMITSESVVIDAGVAVQSGKTVGDAAEELYDREDIQAITPQKGGVGPLTVCALFENTLKAAGATLEE